jgi:hypothetical protein
MEQEGDRMVISHITNRPVFSMATALQLPRRSYAVNVFAGYMYQGGT